MTSKDNFALQSNDAISPCTLHVNTVLHLIYNDNDGNNNSSICSKIINNNNIIPAIIKTNY